MAMNTLLPTLTEINALPLRAIVAFAFRAARRVMLRYNMEHIETLQHALACLEEFVRLPAAPVDIVPRTAEAMASLLGTPDFKTIDTAEIVLCFAKAADCCILAGMAHGVTTADANQCTAAAAGKAVQAASRMNAAEARRAASDYERLIGLFGSYERVELGEPFDPTEAGPLGPL